MTTKRPSGDAFEEEPLEKRGRLEEDVDDIDAELDDEVEKELREFEKLQSGLLDTSTEQGNGNVGGENRSQIVGRESEEQELGKNVAMKGSHVEETENMEQDNSDGSDDLEQEISEERKKNKTLEQEIVNQVPNRSKHPVLNETVSTEDIRILPDTFVEENLLDDDLVEKAGTPEDGEEACLNMERVQLFKDSKDADPLFTSQEQDSKSNPEQTPLPDAQELLRSAQEIMRSQRQILETEELDEDPNDPDFPSPGKRKSRARNNRSKSRRSQKWQPSPEKQTDQEPLTSESPKNIPENHQARSESEKIYPSLPGTSRSGNDLSNVEQFVPKETFVDPVLKIPVQPESLCKDPDFRDPIFDHVSKPEDHQMGKVSPGLLRSRKDLINDRVVRDEQPGEEKIPEKTPALGQRHVRAIDFHHPATRNYDPEVINSQHPRPESPEQDSPKQGGPRPTNPKPPKHPAYLDFLKNATNPANPAPCSEEQGNKVRAPSPGNLSDDSQPTKVTIDITYDQPAEYCVVERIIQRRFKNSFLLDDEKLDLIEADRPEIWCPELFPYTKFYENHTSLAACNELKRFFCWPCLFFAIKVIWSVTCDENSENMIGKEINKHLQSPLHQESIKQHDALMLKKKSSIVVDLFLNNFVEGTWTHQNQEAIIMKGRPRPILDRADRKTTKKYEKLAFKEFYDKFQWICGCTKSNTFYCWPCLLFSRGKRVYVGDIECIESPLSLSLHETTQLHMDACVKLGKWEFDLRKKSEASIEEIKKTRTFLKCLVEILCAEKKKINNVEFSPLDFVDSLELMSRYNEKLRIFIDEKSKNSNIVQIVPQYTTAILDSVEFFIKGSILEEIKRSNFISLIVDHSSGLSNKAILSVIARYVDGNGLVHERFVKLLNVGYNTPSNMLIDEFFQIITELQCRSTLIGFTYDGYLVKPGSIPDFNAKVQKLCPNAKFFHYTEHNFKRVLKQTLCHVPICRRVLQTVKELASFFESTPNARKGLLDIVSAAEKCRSDVWRSPNFITTVFIYHAVIVEIMESITKNAEDWKIKTVVRASNFLDFFKDSTNRFYVTMMARMFDAVGDLSKEIDKEVGVENLKTIASHTALKIQKLGRNFDNLIESACSHLEKSEQEGPRKEMTNLHEQFSNVVKLVVKLVRNRVFGLEKGYFIISNGVPTSNFTYFIKLKRHILHNFALPSNFSSARLSKELKFFHNSPIFSELDLSAIIALMSKYNITQVLPELFKFLQLALTVPKKEYDDSTIPAVRRILAFIEGKKDINSTDALIWMEKEFISNLQKKAIFYEQITDRVLAITKKDSFALSN